ncbi:unnamed protein product [Acanthoscelides obtectus]|uniref:Uncharacterized protein n=1 Tax=Acanthoscelides obtectus TaxID=200917 RepID=A0A9P0L8E9_ACAOB|nr:unnamed protein product [Acanthoscelides obtectus]CAK1621571.1 hypothetical protein AOBTE_LOCUS1020 [Acanthoscelides obtectus]
MSSQRAKLILKLAKTKAKVEKKENGAQDSWKISQHNNIGNTSSTAEEAVNSVTVNKESLNMIESNNIRNSLKEAKNATEDQNNIESVNQIDLPSQNVISQTTIIPGIIFDESSEDIGGVTLINRTRSQGLLRADEYEEFPSSNGSSSELIEEEATYYFLLNLQFKQITIQVVGPQVIRTQPVLKKNLLVLVLQKKILILNQKTYCLPVNPK